ncbi:MAG TPA: hypothetical protein VML19_04990 [Verrucomicrobiae bacterium]|nr:hypothetical protein [Verrucomicrobiae bacterium]
MAEWVGIQIAEWIERGLEFPGVEEKVRVFLEPSDSACGAGVLGLAMIGRVSDPRAAVDRWIRMAGGPSSRKLETAAQFLGISVALARMLELNHRNGVPAASIARGMRGGTLGMRIVSAVPLRAAAA